MSSAIQSHTRYTDATFKDLRREQEQIDASEFYDCTFAHCTFAESILHNCRFVDCAFQHCNLSLVQVPGSTFSGARFEDSKLIGINWTQADWAAPRLGEPLIFTRCTLNHSTFIGLGLKEIQIRDSVAVDVDFRQADLTRATFAGTDLEKSLFSGTNLTEADLSEARNYHVVPGGNTLTKARFSLPEAIALLYSMDIVLEEEEE